MEGDCGTDAECPDGAICRCYEASPSKICYCVQLPITKPLSDSDDENKIMP